MTNLAIGARSHDQETYYSFSEACVSGRSMENIVTIPQKKTEIKILNVPVKLCTFHQGVNLFQEIIAQNRPQMAVLANAHTLNLAYENTEYREVLNNAAVVLRDGTGVSWSIKKKHQLPMHNFVGTDFILDFFRCSYQQGYRVFLLGSRSGVGDIAADRIRKYVPEITIAGCHHGYFSEAETDSVISRINDSHPHVLLVAMGNPKQELWIARNLTKLNVPLSIGVGALFDYLSGLVPRANSWIRKAGMEWVFRLMTEPGRLWRRYVIGNPKFIFRIYRECFNEKWRKTPLFCNGWPQLPAGYPEIKGAEKNEDTFSN